MQEPKYENTFRISVLAGILVVVALAAYATYRLHKIADFQVFKEKPFKANLIHNKNGVFSRSSSTPPKLCCAAYPAPDSESYTGPYCSTQ